MSEENEKNVDIHQTVINCACSRCFVSLNRLEREKTNHLCIPVRTCMITSTTYGKIQKSTHTFVDLKEPFPSALDNLKEPFDAESVNFTESICNQNNDNEQDMMQNIASYADSIQPSCTDAITFIENLYKQHNYSIDKNGIQIFGLRNFAEDKKNVATYNDIIGILFYDGANEHLYCYHGTTDPGKSANNGMYYKEANYVGTSLISGKQEKGLAILCPGQYKYRIGVHGISSTHGYLAFVQDAPVLIFRDKNNANDRSSLDCDISTLQLLDSTINIHTHKGKESTTFHETLGSSKPIGLLSEGCQVIRDGNSYIHFMHIIINEYYGRGIDSTTLINWVQFGRTVLGKNDKQIPNDAFRAFAGENGGHGTGSDIRITYTLFELNNIPQCITDCTAETLNTVNAYHNNSSNI